MRCLACNSCGWKNSGPGKWVLCRPIAAGERVTPNMDHYCLVLGPTDMHQLHAELKTKGVQVEDAVRPAWGAQGYGQQFKLSDPDGNKIELRCYTGS